MENIYHVWLLIAITIVGVALLGYYMAKRSSRKIKRCVHFTASSQYNVITGKYYFRGIKPEHEIRAQIQEELNMRGYYVYNFISIVHIANFIWPKHYNFIVNPPH